MSDILQISEGVSLAFHSLAILADKYNQVIPTCNIAIELQVSENHLAKIHQRLTRAGLIRSIRGPQGGVQLARCPNSISLLNIYEVIEGKFNCHSCIRNHNNCTRFSCIFNGIIKQANMQIQQYLQNTTLQDICSTTNKSC